VVRGAPAIGIAAAYGVVLAARKAYANEREAWRQAIVADCESLRAARPTAVNLGWAIERMRAGFPEGPRDPEPALLAEAKAIHDEDIAANWRMGAIGAAFLKPGARVLTHCNAGSLATGGYGTALGVIRSAYACRKIAQVHANETRPWLQGARLTAWELLRDRIPVTLLADSAAAYLMQRGSIDWVIVGADRIAANGDAANKIGTYGLALAARAHGVRFMVAAPTSTLDPGVPDGRAIPIENRPPEEIVAFAGQRVAALGVDIWNPVFDVTPAELIDVLVTEKGAIEHPDAVSLSALLRKDTGLRCRSDDI
ncbi:MAG: S-methyl-5-thioribose-1-phosphate isomerase, partial [Gammaproteobacteria bacterium]